MITIAEYAADIWHVKCDRSADVAVRSDASSSVPAPHLATVLRAGVGGSLSPPDSWGTLARMTDDERWKQWTEWLETILEYVRTALIYRRIFHEVRAMIDSNPRIQKASSFYDWMAGVYADSGLMAVRRQRGVDERAVSLERLLVDIRKNPPVLSRARFVALYRSDMRGAADAEGAARDRRDLTGETHGVSSSCSRPWRAGRAAARWAAAGRRRETPR